MAKNEKSSERLGEIAARGLKDPKSLTKKEIRALAASVETQRPDHHSPAAAGPSTPKARKKPPAKGRGKK
jgi:hypothetical protein